MASQTDIDMKDEEYEDSELDSEDDSHSDSDEGGETKASANESVEELFVSSAEEKERLRAIMAAEVEAFLTRGGKIQEVDANVMADPPRKPQTSYGSRPI